MKPRLAFVWFVVALALTALLFVNARNARQQKQLLEKVQLQVEKLDQEQKVATVRATEAEKEAQRLRAELRAAEVDASTTRAANESLSRMTNAPAALAQRRASPPQQSENPGGGGMGGMLENMMKDPEMRKAMEQQQRMGLDMVYGSLFKELKLTPEQEAAFKDTLLNLQMTNMAMAGGMFDKNATNRAAIIQTLADARQASEAKMKEILGDEKFEQYTDYTQTMGERMILDQFAKQSDLAPEQSQQLLAIMREEKKNMQINTGGPQDQTQQMQAMMESPDAAEKLLKQQEQVNDRVLERAAQVLTPEQFTKFQPFVTNQLNMQRAGLKMAQQMFKGNEPSPGPPPPPTPVR